jgi:alpha-tubulin suppressor-like RCC1 family protein
MMRIGQFTTLPFVLTIFMGCGGLPEKLPESAFDVPPLDATTPPSDTAIDITPTDVMPPEDILSDVPPLDVPPPEDILADVPPAPDTTPDVPVTPGTFAAECDVVGNFVAVDTGGNHTCGLSNKGNVWCWGEGQHGQLGNKLAMDSNKPVRVVWGGESQSDGALNNVTSIALGEGFGCALQGTNTVVCWGQGESGQLGNGKGVSSNAPDSLVVVTASQPNTVLGNIVSIAVGNHHACGLTTSKRVRCWGSNIDKQLAHSTKSESAVALTLNPLNVQSITAGGSHTCLVGDKNRASCWGNNEFGQLGTDKDDGKSEAQVDKVEYGQVLEDWKDESKGVTAGGLHTCMWRVSLSKLSQEASCWGNNSKGELGYGGSSQYNLAA